MEKLYFDINRDLTLKVAQQAKKANVKLFVYMSSMIVYSSREKCISNDTKPNPDNFYGRSKLEAEQGLESMQDTSFKVAILRPPMIYGKNSKGNFSKLVNYSHKLLFFPKYNNKKSILYIDNLSEMVRIILLEKLNGIFYPRNLDHVSTHEIIYYSSLNIRNKKVILIKFLNPLISVIVRISRLARKVFGDFYYDQNFGIPPMNYQRYGLEDSIKEIFK
jgi:UDP-glucose 4-epimerase